MTDADIGVVEEVSDETGSDRRWRRIDSRRKRTADVADVRCIVAGSEIEGLREHERVPAAYGEQRLVSGRHLGFGEHDVEANGFGVILREQRLRELRHDSPRPWPRADRVKGTFVDIDECDPGVGRRGQHL
jgi:hypothetical protein